VEKLKIMEEWVAKLVWGHLSRCYISRVNGDYIVSFLECAFKYEQLKKEISKILQLLPIFAVRSHNYARISYIFRLLGLGFDFKYNNGADSYMECDLFTFKRSEYLKNMVKHYVLDDIYNLSCQFHDLWRKGHGKYYHEISRMYRGNMKSRDRIYQMVREIYSDWASGYYTVTKIRLLELKEADPDVFNENFRSLFYDDGTSECYFPGRFSSE
jgi:hypothetical protein